MVSHSSQLLLRHSAAATYVINIYHGHTPCCIEKGKGKQDYGTKDGSQSSARDG